MNYKRRPIGIATAMTLIGSVLVLGPAVPTSAATFAGRPTALPDLETSVQGKPLAPRPARPDGERNVNLRLTPTAVFPVRIKADGGRLPITVLDRKSTAQARIPGLVFQVGEPTSAFLKRSAPVHVDYNDFRYAYGGDWASRLQVVRLASCALTTPTVQKCVKRTPVKSRNNFAKGTLTASVSPGTYAVVAGPSGSAGSFKPTSLAPSATWQVGLQSGDFSWSYPIEAPDLPGLGPDINISYSSGAIDGRVAATNNQSSWLGEGFDYHPGFIERAYNSCKDDGQGEYGDQCWLNANAQLSLPGVSGELVKDQDTGEWRTEDDDGWRVRLLTGAGNGDEGSASDKGEHWQLTSPDGTRYFFGLNHLPGWETGGPETNSTWTAPVFGDDAGEPCHGGTLATSSCTQAYRWNLDYVINPHGDVMSMWYDTESNYYAKLGTGVVPYIKGGRLNHIDYGQRDSEVYSTTAPGRVAFTSADRCLSGSSCTQTTPGDWPDTPWDQACGASTCAVGSPTFWQTKRLAKITTQVYSGGGYQNVGSWAFTQTYPTPGDNTSPAMWLESIVHTGLVGGSESTPAVRFDGAQFQNRVDVTGDGFPEMRKRRITTVTSESGGAIQISYTTECAPGSLPVADNNPRKCFPAFWTPELGTQPVSDWWHKQVVSEVAEQDTTGASDTPKVTRYEYSGDQYLPGGAWRRDDSELVPEKHKTWGQWRGYARVRELTGDPAKGQQSLTEHTFFRGMDGDHLANGTAREVYVVDSLGTKAKDSAAFRGFERESIEYNGAGGAWLEKTISEPVLLARTASRPRAGQPGVLLEAWRSDEKTETNYTALDDGKIRTTETRTRYDSKGFPDQIYDLGDLAVSSDDRCMTISYARNEALWILDTEAAVTVVAVPCGTAPSGAGDVIGGGRSFYDGATTFGAGPTKGDETKAEDIIDWNVSGPVYGAAERSVYDVHGREIESYDVYDNKGTVSYQPATGGPVTSITTKNALGHTATQTLHPLLGEALKSVDANGRVTEVSYDPVGRLLKVWLPGRAKATYPSTPNLQYAYALRQNAASSVTTRGLLGDGSTMLSSYSLFDGFLRPRQTQASSPQGGRILTDSFYDSHGRLAKSNAGYHDVSAPGTTLFGVADSTVPSQTVYNFDGAGRETAEILVSEGAEKWRTSTSYGGDWTAVDPPAGATPTTAIVDADGRVIERREYHGASPTGAYDPTRYMYGKTGELEAVTDPAGNVWRYAYDIRGRKVRNEDPDSGVTTMTYDELDRPTTSTDSRGKTVANSYDVLGRRTSVRKDSTDGPLMAEYIYDSINFGALTSSTRWENGLAYRDEVLGFDAAGLPTGSRVTIPAAEGKLAGTYQTTFKYNAAGQVTQQALPAIGGLPAETLLFSYGNQGLPATTKSPLAPYAYATSYTKLGELWQTTLGVPGRQVYQQAQYDKATGRVTRLKSDRDLAPAAVSDVAYGYDPAGNVTKIADRPAGRPADVQCFGYDYLQRLTDAWTATDDCASNPSLSVLGGPAPYWHSYAYDLTGNRTKEIQHATGGDLTRTYSYPANGSHTLRSVVTNGPGVNRTDTYSYDSDGNTTQRNVDGKTQDLSWDYDGHLASVQSSGGSESYLYDADGARLIRRTPGSTTLYLGETELRLTGDTVLGTRYYTHNGAQVATREAKSDGTTSLTWLISDHHGTGGYAVDAATQAVTVRRTLPFGGERSRPPAVWPGEKGFVGGTKDPTGLTHLGAREYDPDTGRFISVDPIIDINDPQQMNGYAYAENNPATLSDPDGLKAKAKAKATTKVNCGNNYDCARHTGQVKPAKPKPKPKPKPKASSHVRCPDPLGHRAFSLSG